MTKEFENRIHKLNSDQVGLEVTLPEFCHLLHHLTSAQNQGKFYQKQFEEAEKQLKEMIVG